MPVIQIETSVAAGAVNNNLVSGSAYEFARRRQVVSIGLVQSATGGFADGAKKIPSAENIKASGFAFCFGKNVRRHRQSAW